LRYGSFCFRNADTVNMDNAWDTPSSTLSTNQWYFIASTIDYTTGQYSHYVYLGGVLKWSATIY